MYNILLKFVILMKLLRLINVCLNETCCEVHTGNHLPDEFPIHSDPREVDALSPLLFKFILEYANRKLEENLA